MYNYNYIKIYKKVKKNVFVGYVYWGFRILLEHKQDQDVVITETEHNKRLQEAHRIGLIQGHILGCPNDIIKTIK
ncbi:hypothetical protein AGMMS49953_10200 [Endomicrobiia bacterium]|nr:hypothetical protein AGMMS49953_10200 [Endomicrobiia bacterium]